MCEREIPFSKHLVVAHTGISRPIEGVYRLTATLTNPAPDRRRKHWAARPEVPEGAVFDVEVDTDFGEHCDMVTVRQGYDTVGFLWWHDGCLTNRKGEEPSIKTAVQAAWAVGLFCPVVGFDVWLGFQRRRHHVSCEQVLLLLMKDGTLSEDDIRRGVALEKNDPESMSE